MIDVRIEGFNVFQSTSTFLVTEIKSDPKNTLLTPSTSNNREARGDIFAASKLEKSSVPFFKTFSPGINLRVSGLGVSSV